MYILHQSILLWLTWYTAGNAKPRILSAISTEPEGKKRTATKKKTSAAKANTSKPRAKVAAGRVTKKTPTKSTATKAKKGPVAKAKDKVTGTAEKAAGTVEKKPGKKGMLIHLLFTRPRAQAAFQHCLVRVILLT
jgi:hypothetical protein